MFMWPEHQNFCTINLAWTSHNFLVPTILHYGGGWNFESQPTKQENPTHKWGSIHMEIPKRQTISENRFLKVGGPQNRHFSRFWKFGPIPNLSHHIEYHIEYALQSPHTECNGKWRNSTWLRMRFNFLRGFHFVPYFVQFIIIMTIIWE